MGGKYRFKIDLWGLLLFLAIMIPNLIWFAVPAPYDLLRAESATAWLDGIASVSQLLMAATLCLIQNRNAPKSRRTAPYLVLAVICCLFYFAVWIFYYRGIADPVIILALCIFPSLAFLFYALEKNNGPAILMTVIFAVCHLLSSVINFI